MPIFALNLWKFSQAKKNLHEYIRGVRDKYEVWLLDGRVFVNLASAVLLLRRWNVFTNLKKASCAASEGESTT